MKVLFRDENLLVVNKPSGLLVHRSHLARDAVTCLDVARDLVGQYVYPVHRLDRGTSGVLIFALSPEVASIMGKQMSAHTMQKEYVAVVRGFVRGSGRIERELKSLKHYGETSEPSETAVTLYEGRECYELPFAVGPYATARYSLVALVPHTGQLHQIRRHLNGMSHPIVGDRVYGDGDHNRFFEEHLGCRRLMLHATALSFTHPITGVALHVDAPQPDEWVEVMGKLTKFSVYCGTQNLSG